MTLVIIGLVVLGIAVCYLFVKAVNALFNPLINKMERKKVKLAKADNPYIQAHRVKMQNDAMYEEYLNWLDKSGGDMPFQKWKTEEERQFESKVNEASSKRWRPGKLN